MTTIITTGNLTTDPEVRHTPNGRTVATFTLIENRRRRTESGWEDAEPNVFRVEVWGQLAENVGASLHKGDRATIEGHIVTDRWNDKETGAARTAQHIVAEEVAFSLRWHTVEATKNAKAAVADEQPAPWEVADIPQDEKPF